MENLQYSTFEIDSKMIKGNALGNPSTVNIHILSGKKPDGKPLLVFLPGFLGSGKGMLFNEDPLSENMYQKLQRLYSKNKIDGCIYAFPDIHTNIGGCQYTDSKVAGNYESFLIKELIPKLKNRYGCGKVAVLGKSSGGYGAMTIAMKHSNVIDAAMDHSGDAYFEFCYMHDFPMAREAIEPFGSAENWLKAYMSKPNKKQGNDIGILNIVAMAAYYSESRKIELPFDIETGEIIDRVWKNWLSKDPVRMIDSKAENLKTLDFLGIDIGLRDQFNLLIGNRILHKKMGKYKIRHFYEEFDDSHTNVGYRYDLSIPLVEKALMQL